MIPDFSWNCIDIVIASDIGQVGEYLARGEELLAVHVDGAEEPSLVRDPEDAQMPRIPVARLRSTVEPPRDTEPQQ